MFTLTLLATVMLSCVVKSSISRESIAGIFQETGVNSLKHDVQAVTSETAILARVNGEAITQKELHRVLTDMLMLSGPQLSYHDYIANNLDYTANYEELEHEALRQLIHRRLILQGADRQQLSISQQELDGSIIDLRSHFVDLGSFGAWMQDRGFDDRSLIDTLRDDMLVKHFMALLVENISLTEQEVVDYHAFDVADLTIGEEVRLRIIIVGSRALAEDILMSLRNGKNFSLLARQYSLGMRAALGGDTGWFNIETLEPSLRKIVDMLRPGEASHPLQKNADEVLIVALAGRRAIQAENLDEARSVIRQRLLAAKQKETVQNWLAKQELNSNIEVFLKTESFTESTEVT